MISISFYIPIHSLNAFKIGKWAGMKNLIGISLIIFLAASFAGCGYLLAGGAGATGGYVLRDQGYKVQSPVKKEQENQASSEKKQTQDNKPTNENDKGGSSKNPKPEEFKATGSTEVK